MSGHSKWATTKRRKGAQDAKRGAAFTKIAKAIAIAARKGPNPEANFELKLAIDKARAANMPNANVEKAIARGSGTAAGEVQIEEIMYEGYAPGGVALIIKCATDNRNRTLTDVRTAFSKNGGNMAETGAVSYQFEQKGVITIESSNTEDDLLTIIDAGAEDVAEDGSILTVYTEARSLHAVTEKLKSGGFTITAAELSYVPKQVVSLNDVETARKVIRLTDALEDLDDVSSVYSNFDISEEVAREIS